MFLGHLASRRGIQGTSAMDGHFFATAARRILYKVVHSSNSRQNNPKSLCQFQRRVFDSSFAGKTHEEVTTGMQASAEPHALGHKCFLYASI